MLNSVFLKTLRDQRVPAVAWGVGLGLLALINAVGWAHSYPDAHARQALAMQVQSGGLSSVEVLFGEPHHIDKLSGWLEWRAMGMQRIILGIVVALTAAGIARGSEESGTLECVLAASSSRLRVFLEQSLAVLGSLAITCAGIWIFLFISPAASGEPAIPLLHSVEAVANLMVGGVFAGAVTLVMSQLTTSRRSAALMGGSLVIALQLWDNIGAVSPSLAGFRAVSPYYLASRSSPLGTGHIDVPALAGLVLLSLALVVVACWLLTRRDFRAAFRLPRLGSKRGSPLDSDKGSDPRRQLGLRSPFLRGLAEVQVPVLAWGVGLAIFCGGMTALAPNLRDAYANASGPLRSIISGQLTDSRLISFLVFGFMPLFASFYAVTLASSWVEEELDGRLELELACPIPRVRYFLQRLAASVLAMMLVVGLAGIGMYVGAFLAKVDLSWSSSLVALALLLPFSSAIVSFGYCVSSLSPRLVVGLGSAALLASYLLDILAALFGLPALVQDLSIFHLYGNPLLNGIDWASTLALVLVATVLAGAGSIAFSRRDITR